MFTLRSRMCVRAFSMCKQRPRIKPRFVLDCVCVCVIGPPGCVMKHADCVQPLACDVHMSYACSPLWRWCCMRSCMCSFACLVLSWPIIALVRLSCSSDPSLCSSPVCQQTCLILRAPLPACPPPPSLRTRTYTTRVMLDKLVGSFAR